MIVIPMAGMSSRFAAAGYKLPKYMLEAHGQTLFAHAVKSFEAYFDKLPFLFIARNIDETESFIHSECNKLGIISFKVVMLDFPTSGQAETVAIGLERALIDPAEMITIFNIDTFRPGFKFPPNLDLGVIDGYLEVFKGEGANWSYVLPDSSGNNSVLETTEKVPVSDLCCTGLYHFKSAKLFLEAYGDFRDNGRIRFKLNELYIAPMYNLLIQKNADIRYSVIDPDEVIFCGVPAEYLDFLAL